MSAERRQSPRYLVSVPSTVTTAAGQSYVCEILDVSQTGCRIRLDEATSLGSLVKLATETDETVARVMWSRDQEAGLWFPNAAEQEQPVRTGFLGRMWSQIRGAA